VARLPRPVYADEGVGGTGVGGAGAGGAGAGVGAARRFNPHQAQTVLVSCEGEGRLLGVVRKHSNVLELYFSLPAAPSSSSSSSSGTSSPPFNFLNVQLQAPQDVSNAHEAAGSAYFGDSASGTPSVPPSSAQGVSISVTACHVIVSERTYIISVLGRLAGGGAGGSVYLLSGSVTLPASPEGTARSVRACLEGGMGGMGGQGGVVDVTPFLATLRQRVLVDDTPSGGTGAGAVRAVGAVGAGAVEAGPNSSFCGRFCALATADALYVVDLLQVYTAPPGVPMHSVCVAVLPCHVGDLGRGASWADAVLLLTPEYEPYAPSISVGAGVGAGLGAGTVVVGGGVGGGGGGGGRGVGMGVQWGALQASSLSLLVQKTGRSALLRFRIKCLQD
ncbi:hypothetical protein B484DRAFT_392571, partial [Ochromonadaceae sp. CCMP2298]